MTVAATLLAVAGCKQGNGAVADSSTAASAANEMSVGPEGSVPLAREEDVEGRAAALALAHPGATTVQLSEPGDERESDPRPGRVG